MRYELDDHEWAVIKLMLPNKPRGIPRVNDRRVLNGIFWVLRSAAPWRDLPDAAPTPLLQSLRSLAAGRCVEPYHRRTCRRSARTCTAGHDAAVQMIDISIVRVHQHGACISQNRRQSMGRSRGGLTSKIHALVDTHGLPVRLAVSPCEAPRQSACWQTSFSPEDRVDAACRPRLRHRLDQRTRHQERRMGQHPAEKQSQRSDLLQSDAHLPNHLGFDTPAWGGMSSAATVATAPSPRLLPFCPVLSEELEASKKFAPSQKELPSS
jgi:transposase